MAKQAVPAPSDGGLGELSVHVEVLAYADLIPVQLNARYMTHETYQRLVANIKRDGHPTQIPFAWLNRDRGGYEVLSGNHRRDATLEALGQDYTGPVLVTDDELPRERRIAIQLSHNSISGDDDPAILRELYESVGEVDWKLYSALDDKTLELLEQVGLESLSEANLDFQTVTLLFLPDELDAVRQTFEQARAAVPPGATWLAARADYDRTLDSLAVVGGAWDVKNQALALRLLVDLAHRHLTDLDAGWWDGGTGEPTRTGTVPLAAILGLDALPMPTAVALKRLVDDLTAAGTIDRPQDALAHLIAVYQP